MAIIIDNDLILVAGSAISVQSTADGFSKANVMIMDSLKRRWRMDSYTESDTNPVMRIDMGAAKTVEAVVLDDVNFSKVNIKGHATDLSDNWAAADFETTAQTVSCDAQTGRYKIYIPLTAFNYRWLAIIVPTASSPVGTYTSKIEIGRIALLDTATEFTKNMSYGYERGAERAYSELELKSGHTERETDGPIRWVGRLNFSHRTTTQETDLTTMNNYDIGDTLVFYENNSDTSKCYICERDTNYMGTVIANGVVTGSTIKLREKI